MLRRHRATCTCTQCVQRQRRAIQMQARLRIFDPLRTQIR